MTLFYPFGRCCTSKPHAALESSTLHDILEVLVVDEMVEGVTEAGGLGDGVVGVEMDESPMSSEVDVEERLVVVTVEREEAVVNP